MSRHLGHFGFLKYVCLLFEVDDGDTTKFVYAFSSLKPNKDVKVTKLIKFGSRHTLIGLYQPLTVYLLAFKPLWQGLFFSRNLSSYWLSEIVSLLTREKFCSVSLDLNYSAHRLLVFQTKASLFWHENCFGLPSELVKYYEYILLRCLLCAIGYDKSFKI